MPDAARSIGQYIEAGGKMVFAGSKDGAVHPKPCNSKLNAGDETRNPELKTFRRAGRWNPKPETRNPNPGLWTLNPDPRTRNPKPYILNPHPEVETPHP